MAALVPCEPSFSTWSEIVHAIRSTRGPAERALMGCFYRTMPIVVAPSDVALSASVSALLTGVAEQRRTLRGQMRISMSALQDLLPRRSARAEEPRLPGSPLNPRADLPDAAAPIRRACRNPTFDDERRLPRRVPTPIEKR